MWTSSFGPIGHPTSRRLNVLSLIFLKIAIKDIYYIMNPCRLYSLPQKIVDNSHHRFGDQNAHLGTAEPHHRVWTRCTASSRASWGCHAWSLRKGWSGPAWGYLGSTWVLKTICKHRTNIQLLFNIHQTVCKVLARNRVPKMMVKMVGMKKVKRKNPREMWKWAM